MGPSEEEDIRVRGIEPRLTASDPFEAEKDSSCAPYTTPAACPGFYAPFSQVLRVAEFAIKKSGLNKRFGCGESNPSDCL